MEIKNREKVAEEINGNETARIELLNAKGKKGEDITFYSYERVWITPEGREKDQKKITFGNKDMLYLSKLITKVLNRSN